MNFTFGSLFAGIGGIDLGLERAGMTCSWQVEIDDYCNRVLAKHWPDVPRYRDVRDCGAHNLERVDLIAGGFPCQPVSVAGRRLGQQDDRWLWPEFARTLRELRPRYAIMENVPGLLVRGMGDVLADLASFGFDAEWTLLSAAQFGAPHLRRRVFVVAHAYGTRQLQPSGRVSDEWRRASNGSCAEDGTDADSRRYGTPENQVFPRGVRIEPDDWWATEPDVGRVANGVPARVDRLRGLGNAVVPIAAEWIGRRILEVDAA